MIEEITQQMQELKDDIASKRAQLKTLAKEREGLLEKSRLKEKLKGLRGEFSAQALEAEGITSLEEFGEAGT